MCVHVYVWVKAVVSTVAMQCSVFVYTYITRAIIVHKCLGCACCVLCVGTAFNAALPMELAMVR